MSPASALPPELLVQDQEYRPSQPHLEEPLLAPRPHKLTPDLPAEVGSTMSSQCTNFYLYLFSRWHAPSTTKSPAFLPFLPPQLITTMTVAPLFPLTQSTSHPVSLSLGFQRRSPGLRGIFPSPVHHPNAVRPPFGATFTYGPTASTPN
jgi:hypothetical protein